MAGIGQNVLAERASGDRARSVTTAQGPPIAVMGRKALQVGTAMTTRRLG
jgi:hypothetical protein